MDGLPDSMRNRFLKARAVELIAKDDMVIVDLKNSTVMRAEVYKAIDEIKNKVIEIPEQQKFHIQENVKAAVKEAVQKREEDPNRNNEIKRIRESRDRIIDTMKQLADELVEEQEKVYKLKVQIQNILTLSEEALS